MATLDSLIEWWERIFPIFGGLIVPVATLVFGWLAALILGFSVRRILLKTQLDEKFFSLLMGEESAAEIRPERLVGKIVFYLAMLFVLVAFFQLLGMTALTEPLNEMLNRIFAYAPRLFSAAFLLFVAWVAASLTRRLVKGVISRTRLEARLAEPAGIETPLASDLPGLIGNTVYWLIYLAMLPAILDALGMDGLLQPVRDMVAKVIGVLPNLLAAAVIVVFGWLAARIIQRVVVNILEASGTNDLVDRIGISPGGEVGLLSRVTGALAYSVVLALSVIAALDSLNFRAISEPASAMLAAVLQAVPSILVAGAIILIGYLVARFVSRLTDDLLRQVGMNSLLQRLGIAETRVAGDREPSIEESTSDESHAQQPPHATFALARPPSQIAGYLAMVAILLFAATEAASHLGFDSLAGTLVRITLLFGKLMLATLVVGLGLYLASLFGNAIEQRGGPYSAIGATIVRVGILSLSVVIGLKEMGIADQIIVLAFGLILGAVAIAAAIAFGFGCRDLARSHAEAWVEKIRRRKDD